VLRHPSQAASPLAALVSFAVVRQWAAAVGPLLDRGDPKSRRYGEKRVKLFDE
jgi:hypothetical protein